MKAQNLISSFKQNIFPLQFRMRILKMYKCSLIEMLSERFIDVQNKELC